MSQFFFSILLFIFTFFAFPQSGFGFSERIRIWQILPPFSHRFQVEKEQKHSSADLGEKTRQEFAEAMGRERMEEMWRVREDLAEMRRRLMAKWGAEGLMEPSALLAQAMISADQRNSNPERLSLGQEGVSLLNRPIDEFLYQSDILLDQNQTKQMLADLEGNGSVTILEQVEEGEGENSNLGEFLVEKRKRRQAQTGRNFPRNQWEPAIPIPFFFDPKLAESTRKLVRLAAQFWTEHTCLSLAENGPGSPRVKFFPGGGCYSQVGRAFHQREQLISLGRGCEQFGIAAHEIGHTLGFFHGQARFDRDQFVNVVYSNLSPQMAGQFVKQTPEDNFNFGVTYDYGSIMHYSDTDVATNRVTMLARERIYQHTMGNNVKPSFLDVLEMNLYYKCTDHCNAAGADCKNGGYRHPRDCNKCICLDGFGGFDCSERASPVFGAPSDCGATLEANEGMKMLNGSVSAGMENAGENGMAERHAQCWWHIRAPAGKRVQFRVKAVSGACSDGCFYGGTELKPKDFLRVGARICCRSDIRPLGILYSQNELAMVSVFSQFKTQRFSIEFRAVDPSIVPRGGVGDYDDLEGKKAEADAKVDGQNEGGRQLAECRDFAGNCFSLLHLCDNTLYRTLMNRQCAKSCMKCNEGGDQEGGGGRGGGGSGNGGLTVLDGECGKRDHESCHTWANNGFCQSKSYSLQIKRQICPRECQLC